MNEHMHYLLRKHGVIMSMDESISVSFMNKPPDKVPNAETTQFSQRPDSEPLMVTFEESQEPYNDRTISSERMKSLLVQDKFEKFKSELQKNNSITRNQSEISSKQHNSGNSIQNDEVQMKN